MTVEADIFTALKSLVSDRCYWDAAPLGVTAPYIVCQQVGGEAPTFLERAVPSKKNGRFQIAVWAPSRITASAIVIQIEGAMVAGTAFDAKPLGAPIGTYDEETKLKGAMQDFTVWSNR